MGAQSSTIKNLAIAYARGFGAGYSPVAPGTVGSLQGVALGLFLHWSMTQLSLFPATKAILVGLILCLLTWLTFVSIATYEDEVGVHDDQKVVADEIIGQAIGLSTMPLWIPTWSPRILAIAALSFLVFRILDIKKPWLIGVIDRTWPGAAGTLGDDILAGVLAAVFTAGINFLPFIANLPISW
jgi:phosphatidylglycerophosphatase A